MKSGNTMIWMFIVALLQNASLGSAERNWFAARKNNALSVRFDHVEGCEYSKLLCLRGGGSKKKRRKAAKSASLDSSKTVTGKKKVGAAAAAAKQSKKSAIGDLWSKYKQMLPLTRLYITMVGVCTLLSLFLGDELTQGLLAMNPLRVLYGLELWRPLTAASFLGPPSVGWLFSVYYLFQYGSSLERAYGTPQHLVFLVTQIFVLSIFSALLGQPFFGPSVITAMLHVLSRGTPHQKTNWLIFKVPFWTLPYGLMATDVLQAQSPSAALPHILGILAGHIYHFHKFVWPKVGGEDWLNAPNFLVSRLDPEVKKTKETISQTLKGRKKGKGRKLSS